MASFFDHAPPITLPPSHSIALQMSSRAQTSSHSRPFMGTKLQPRQGVPAGLWAGIGMLALWLAGAQLWGEGAEALVASIGAVITPENAPAPLIMGAGIGLHLLISAGLGMLFAVSLDRLDSKDTIIVSTSYGFTLWVVSVLILRHWEHVDAIQMSRSWWGLVVFLLFGLLLGMYANRFGQKPAQ